MILENELIRYRQVYCFQPHIANFWNGAGIQFSQNQSLKNGFSHTFPSNLSATQRQISNSCTICCKAMDKEINLSRQLTVFWVWDNKKLRERIHDHKQYLNTETMPNVCQRLLTVLSSISLTHCWGLYLQRQQQWTSDSSVRDILRDTKGHQISGIPTTIE